MENNPHDDLGKEPDWSEDDKKTFEKLDYLIHKTFAQTEEGKELLNIWIENLTMSSSANPGDDMLVIGIQEGIKTFIRNIILTIRKVENE